MTDSSLQLSLCLSGSDFNTAGENTHTHASKGVYPESGGQMINSLSSLQCAAQSHVCVAWKSNSFCKKKKKGKKEAVIHPI